MCVLREGMPMEHSEPIVRRKLSDEVFTRLKRLITSGELNPGDEMPSERELMERFGVGRPAIREAMQALANMGLVAISHGERAKVLKLTAQSILRQVDGAAKIMLSSSKDSLEHLKSARIFFERGMVREAAEKATAADVDTLKSILERQRGLLGNADGFIDADMELHTHIAIDLGQSDLRGGQRGYARMAEGVSHGNADLDRQGEVHACRAREDHRPYRRA